MVRERDVVGHVKERGIGKLLHGGCERLSSVRGVRLHHLELNNYDGTGYPRGLAGDDLPLCGRIVALAEWMSASVARFRRKRGAALGESRRH